MTVAALAWAIKSSVPNPAKAVLVALANCSDEAETCFPGIERIAQDSSVSPRTVKRSIVILEDAGMISRERRYNGFGGRTSNRYRLHVGVDYVATSESESPRYDVGSAENDVSPPSLVPTSEGGDSVAPNDGRGPVDNFDGPLGVQLAPNDGLPAEKAANASPLGANWTALGARRSPLKEEPPELTPRNQSSSSSAEVTREAPGSDTEAAALPPDDDGDFDGGGGDSAALVFDEPATVDNHEPVDLHRLLRAGIEASLRELDARLNLSEILRRLSDAGVDGERVDVTAAAAFALSAAARRVGDPSAYVAAAIVREPARWPWRALPAAGSSGGGSSRSACEVQGHRYLDEYRMQCVRCHQERPGWREERYAVESRRSDRERAEAS